VWWWTTIQFERPASSRFEGFLLVPFPKRCLWILTALALMPGCASPQLYTPRVPACRAQAVVFVVDGAGGFHSTARTLYNLIEEEHLPLCMFAVDWNHAYGRALADHLDHENQALHGYLLAQRIIAFRHENPTASVSVVTHSSGSGILILAAQYLPPDILDHAVILAPSVSECADLRKVLAASRGGVDVFTSHRDLFYLGLLTGLLGTTEGTHDTPAGRYGFKPRVCTPEDGLLYLKLRQHPWDPSVTWTGHYGTHTGSHFPRFLRAYVLPIILTPVS
jgi:hypothetical protein